jgi:hypothetical protein
VRCAEGQAFETSSQFPRASFLRRDPFTRQLDAQIALDYSCAMRGANVRMWLSHAFLLFGLIVVVPSIAAAIGHAAWNGKPKNFGRDMYWTVFIVACAATVFLGGYAQRMYPDVRTWLYLAQTVLMGLAELFFGIAAGCMVAIFVYRRGAPSQ